MNNEVKRHLVINEEKSFSISSSKIKTELIFSMKPKIDDYADLLVILEMLINYLDLDTDAIDDLIIKYRYFKGLNIIYEKIRSRNKCVECSSNNRIITNECGHKFCIFCAGKLISTDGKCSKCKAILSHDFTIQVYSNANSSQRMKVNILCYLCNKRQIESIETSCNHLCFTCMKTFYDKFENNCPICDNPLFSNGIYEKELIKCPSCKERRYIINDSCDILSCEDLMCGYCISESIEIGSCKKCMKKFNQIDLIGAIRKVSKTCSNCLKNVSWRYLERLENRYICNVCKRK